MPSANTVSLSSAYIFIFAPARGLPVDTSVFVISTDDSSGVLDFVNYIVPPSFGIVNSNLELSGLYPSKPLVSIK